MQVGTGKTCLPYPFPGCAHHVAPTDEVPACPSEDYDTPRCRVSCSEAAYEKMYLADKQVWVDAPLCKDPLDPFLAGKS